MKWIILAALVALEEWVMTGKDIAVGGAKISAAMALAVLIGFVARQVRRANGGKAAFLGLVLLVFAGPAMALKIQWDPPTTRVDGSALDPATEIAAYHFYCGMDTGGPYDVVSYRIPGTVADGVYEVADDTLFPEYGDYQCVMTAEDQHGQESAYSEEVTVTYMPAPPGVPTNVLVITRGQ